MCVEAVTTCGMIDYAVPCWSLCVLECKVGTCVCTCPWDVYVVCKVVEFDSNAACQY